MSSLDATGAPDTAYLEPRSVRMLSKVCTLILVKQPVALLVNNDLGLVDGCFGGGVGTHEGVSADEVVGFYLAVDFLGDVGGDAVLTIGEDGVRSDGEVFVGFGGVFGGKGGAAEEFFEEGHGVTFAWLLLCRVANASGKVKGCGLSACVEQFQIA